MATVERNLTSRAEQRIVLHDVPWETYLSLSMANGEGPVQLTYDQGTLEIMAPSYYHELMSRFIHDLIRVLTTELGMEMRSGGSTTMRSEPERRGAEADEIYHIRNEAAIRSQREFDPALPPDLAVEVDISASSSRRLPIYSSLGIPEVWRCDGERFTFLSLGDVPQAQGGEYRPIARSLSFPRLSPADLDSFLAKYDAMGENVLLGEFRQWVRETQLPE
ncbi:MAG TPA: Uma2 family endonuclease [Pirellulales bacterium]|nr:Uma2 family endonuclease [Pirellulales bacterium]